MRKILLENSRQHNHEGFEVIKQEVMDLDPITLSESLLNKQKDLISLVLRQLLKIHTRRFEDKSFSFQTDYQCTTSEGSVQYHIFQIRPHGSEFKLSPKTHFERTCFNYVFDKDSTTLYISPRIFPTGFRTYIHYGMREQDLTEVFHGTALLRRIWKERYHNDSKEVWTFQAPVIKQSINNAVQTIYQDVLTHKNFVKYEPHQIMYISGSVLENIIHLMTLVSVNHNIMDFKLMNLDRTKRNEYIELTYTAFQRDPYALNFTESAMQFGGLWLKYMIENDYSHLIAELRK